MPLFHVHGLIGALLSTLYSSGTSVIPAKFSATAFWNQFSTYHCTWYSAVPTIHSILLSPASLATYSPNLSSRLKFIRSCSSPLLPATLSKIISTFKVPVFQAYAMTEAAHQMTSTSFISNVPGSVGRSTGPELKILAQVANNALSTVVEMDVDQDGEVCVRGDTIFSGYLNKKATDGFYTFEDKQWFRTGDIGRKGKQGELWLTGREKEMINRGGEKISPVEIDAVLMECKGIKEAVSFGVASDIYGEEVECAVAFSEGARLNEKEVKEWCERRLAKFKVPRKVWVVKEIEKTGTGKIQRGAVAKKFSTAKL